MKGTQDKLRSYQAQIKKIDTKMALLKTEKDDICRELSSLGNRKNKLQDKVDSIKNASKKPVVSDHAIVRYLERVIGMDLDDLKDEIINSETHECKKDGNVITTIITK